MRVRVEEVGEGDVEKTERRQDGARRDEGHDSGAGCGWGPGRTLFDMERTRVRGVRRRADTYGGCGDGRSARFGVSVCRLLLSLDKTSRRRKGSGC